MRALSHADFGGTGKPSGFSYSLSEDRVKVGQRVQITIDAPKAPGYDILVMTAYTGPDSAHYWPVLVVTDDFAGARAPGQPPPEAIAKLHPPPRLGEAEEVAAMADLLLSPDAGWITGQVIAVDGGRGTLRSKAG